MNGRRRKTAVALAVLLCFVLLFCHLCLAVNANHECVGDGCTVCQVMKTCENILKTLSCVTAAVASAAVYCSVMAASLLHTPVDRSRTPVAWKIKLTD